MPAPLSTLRAAQDAERVKVSAPVALGLAIVVVAFAFAVGIGLSYVALDWVGGYDLTFREALGFAFFAFVCGLKLAAD